MEVTIDNSKFDNPIIHNEIIEGCLNTNEYMKDDKNNACFRTERGVVYIGDWYEEDGKMISGLKPYVRPVYNYDNDRTSYRNRLGFRVTDRNSWLSDVGTNRYAKPNHYWSKEMKRWIETPMASFSMFNNGWDSFHDYSLDEVDPKMDGLVETRDGWLKIVDLDTKNLTLASKDKNKTNKRFGFLLKEIEKAIVDYKACFKELDITYLDRPDILDGLYGYYILKNIIHRLKNNGIEISEKNIKTVIERANLYVNLAEYAKFYTSYILDENKGL
jgi:hypothetical protein